MIVRAIPAMLITAVCATCPAQQAPDEQVARQALIGAITGNDAALRQSYATASRMPVKPGGVPLSDAVYYLYNCTRTSRDEFLAGQEIVLSNTKIKEWQYKLTLSLLTDEVYELNRLEGQARFNKYTRIFNRVSTSLSQLVLLQPQAAASLIWDGIYTVKKGREATTKERKMVFLCDQFLKKFPSALERNDVIALRDQLKAKMIKDRADALTAAGKTAISEGKFQLAEWHLEKAALLAPANQDTKTLLGHARTLHTRSDEMMGLSLGVSTAEGQLSAGQSAALGDAAHALITGKTDGLTAAAQKEPGIGDSVQYALASIHEKGKDHESALTRLRNISASAPQAPGGKAAKRLLDNPNYNLSDSFQKAVAEMASDQKHFIWSGRRTKDEAVYSVGSTAIQNAANPVAVPVLFGLDAAVRAISENFRTQVSVDGVIDAGARYRRRYPDSPQSKQIAGQLAALSKKAGDYRRSKEFLEEAGGGSPEEIAKLDENLARAKYEELKKSANLLQSKKLLDELERDYANTSIVKKNLAKERAKLPPTLADDTIYLTADMLGKDRRLAASLGIPDYLVDSSKGNGEIGKDGIAITPSANVVQFKLNGETQWRQAGLSQSGRDIMITAIGQLRREAMSNADAKELLNRQIVPLSLDGGVGSGGIDAAPHVVPYSTAPRDQNLFGK